MTIGILKLILMFSTLYIITWIGIALLSNTTFQRILRFKKQDWQHIRFLIGCAFKAITNFDFKNLKLACFFIKLHCTHDSQLIERDE